MLQAKNSLIGNNIVNNNEMTGSPLNNPTVIEYPKLEDLTVVPTKEQQEFESKKYYGYKKVIVEGVEGEVLDIKPSEETQVIEGLFNTVNVEKIETEEKQVELDFSDADINEIIPNEGKYLKSVLIEKSPDLQPENIIKDKIIDGVKGNVEILDTSDATATSDDILSPATAYVNGEKIEGTMLSTYEKINLSWEITKRSGGTNPAIFGMNDKYLFYYNSTTSNFVLENIETGEIDTLSSSIYSFTTGQWASIVLGCIYNNTECYGIAVSEGSQQGLFIRVKNNKIVTYKVQNVNDYNRVLMLTPGKTHPNLFCSEYRSNSSGGKSMRIFTLDENLDFSYSYVVYMLYSDYSIIGTFAKDDSYYISISGSGTGKTMKSMYMKYLKWYGTTLSSVSNVSNPVSTIYYCNNDMTYLISGETLYSLTASRTSVTATSLKTISYTGTGLFFLGNFFITYSGTNIYVYELKDSTLSLVKQLILNTSVNLQYVNTNNKEALFQAGSYMEYLKYDGEKIFTKITRGEEEFYRPYDADITADDIRKGKIAYGANGKIEGTLEGGGEYNAVIDSSLVTVNNSSNNSYLINRMITKLPNKITFSGINMKSIAYLFNEYQNLENIPQMNTENIIYMNNAFMYCKKITEIPELNTGNVIDMNNLFFYCSKLEKVPKLDASKVNNISLVFYKCSALTDCGGLIDLGKAYTQKTNNYSNYKLDFHHSTKLTHESLMNVINNLYDLNLTYDVANGGTLYTQSLQLGSTNMAKLTAEEIAMATSKRLDSKLIKGGI